MSQGVQAQEYALDATGYSDVHVALFRPLALFPGLAVGCASYVTDWRSFWKCTTTVSTVSGRTSPTNRSVLKARLRFLSPPW